MEDLKNKKTTRSYNCLRDVMTAEQERAFYDNILQRVFCYPRYYLDNLDYLDTFRVSFLEYWEKRRVKPKRNKRVFK